VARCEYPAHGAGTQLCFQEIAIFDDGPDHGGSALQALCGRNVAHLHLRTVVGMACVAGEETYR
jgi:hypothetical protein